MKDLKPGDLVDHYTIMEKFDHDGMGEVYLAEDLMLSRLVVLKFHKEESSQKNMNLHKRFKNEANIIASIKDEHIIDIYSFGTYEGMSFMVMEYFEGDTVADRLKEKPFEMEDALKIIVELLKGLNVIHKKGIIHRDIKPSNILLSEDNDVKIIDFGISKRSLDENSKITQTDHLVGTMQYMAPEVLSGQSPSPSSDLFSVGMVLYEMLVGSNPYDGMNKFATMDRIKNKPLKLPKIKAKPFPSSLEQAFRKMVAIDPRIRFQTLDSAIKELRSIKAVDTPSFDKLLNSEGDKALAEKSSPPHSSLAKKWDEIEAIGPFTVPTVQELKTQHRPNLLFIFVAILFLFLNKNILDFTNLNSEIKSLKQEVAELKELKNKMSRRDVASVKKISPIMIPGNRLIYDVVRKSGSTGKKISEFKKEYKIIKRLNGELKVGVKINGKKSLGSLLLNKNPLIPSKRIHPKHGADIQLGTPNTLQSLFPMKVGQAASLNYFKLNNSGTFNEHNMVCRTFAQVEVPFKTNRILVYKISCETKGPGYKETALYFYSPDYDQLIKSEVAITSGKQSIIEISSLKEIITPR